MQPQSAFHHDGECNRQQRRGGGGRRPARMFRPIDIPARAARRPCSKEGALRGKSELNERLKLAGASGVSFVSEEGVPQSQISLNNISRARGRRRTQRSHYDHTQPGYDRLPGGVNNGAGQASRVSFNSLYLYL